jgi:hypothetical protein
MPRLTFLSRLRRGGERGGAAALVAVLLGGGVVMGFTALSIDVGTLMWERRQVQNGADAAALALAQTCAETPAQCSPAVPSTLAMLNSYNNGNARDGHNGLDPAQGLVGVCGRNVPTLPGCSSPVGNVQDCPAVSSSLDPNAQFVEVHTRTESSGGSSILPTWLIKTLNNGSSGTTVKACARAAWGDTNPTSGLIFPIVMSFCDWKAQTGYSGPGTAVYPPGPSESITPYGYGPTNPWTGIAERVVYTKNNPANCSTWNGHSAPGGFYSINEGGPCTANSTVGGWVHATTGNSSPCSGMTMPDGSSIKGKVIHLPVFDCLYNTPTTITGSTDCTGSSPKASGSNVYYHIMGYAAFYVTGWYFSSDSQPSIKSGATPCSGGDRCLSGWFLKDLVSEGDIQGSNPGGPPNLGLTVIQAAG